MVSYSRRNPLEKNWLSIIEMGRGRNGAGYACLDRAKKKLSVICFVVHIFINIGYIVY